MTLEEWYDAEGWKAATVAGGGHHLARAAWDASAANSAEEIAALKELVEKLGDRCVGLVELVSAKAAKKEWKCPSCGESNCDGYCTVDSWDFSECRGG